VIEVIKPGALLTVQDLGRTGYQQAGIPVSGAMDGPALRTGNILVGNPPGAAGLEAALTGAELKAHGDLLIAVTGAAQEVEMDGHPVPAWKSFRWEKGAVLRIKGRPVGAWSYIAVAGGVDVPEILGSRSTCLVAGFGGFEGRTLRSGDLVPVGRTEERRLSRLAGRRLGKEWIPAYARYNRIRVTLGPHCEAFTERGIRDFLDSEYEVTPQINRMGARLRGESVEHAGAGDILSCATTFGTIQVPADGQPVILLADRQTTGGYPQIATVISVDLPLVAQALPGDRIAFKEVSAQDAVRLYRERERRFRVLEANNGICTC
jgi:biotin-dependent carboxylase-like uncharacterized protein